MNGAPIGHECDDYLSGRPGGIVMTSLDVEYFDTVYRTSTDPWNFATSEYEHRKYAATLRALGPRRFERTLEIGCSIGVLSGMLADRTDELVAIDVSASAIRSARARNAGRANASFSEMSFPREYPTGHFDLVVVSEVAYYWAPSDLGLAIDRIALVACGGFVELVHYLPKVEDYPLSGDEVHEFFLQDARFQIVRSVREDRYRLDVLAVST
jgi:SAM-dependent methyltransferase